MRQDLLLVFAAFAASALGGPVPAQDFRIIQTDDANYQNQPWPHMEVISEDMKLFAHRPRCRDACARSCKPIMLADTDQVFFICPQVKPPEKSIPEKFFAKMSFPLILLLGVVVFATFVCLICCCRSMCCHNHSRSAHSSREGLHQKHLQDITDDGANEKSHLPVASIEDHPALRPLRSTTVHDV
uniref:Uncharacterized protein n=1 Tax=Panagrolaimus sp. JU765 TaxID=591449 RepID=A0AC34R968_9BILA